MANEFTAYGYSQVRTYVKNTFANLGIYDGTTQRKVFANPTITENANTLTYSITVTNTDGALTNVKVDNVRLFQSTSNTNAVAQADFSDFTFESVDDTLTVSINIQIPTV